MKKSFCWRFLVFITLKTVFSPPLSEKSAPSEISWRHPWFFGIYVLIITKLQIMKNLPDIKFSIINFWLRIKEHLRCVVGDLVHRIAHATMTTINTTAISVGITSTSYLYPKDRWSPDGRYEITCYEYYGNRFLDTFHLNGSIPQWAILTGLQNYTLYKCYALHFGLLDGKVKFHVMSSYYTRYSGSNGKISLIFCST